MNDSYATNDPPPSSPLHPASSEPPPTYDQITFSPEAPPPSYDSVFGKVKEAQQSSSGLYDFFRKLFSILLTTLGCALTLGFSLLIPGSFLIIGSIYVHDCPAEYMIPIFIIVLGVKGVISVLLTLYQRHLLKKDDPNIPDTPEDEKAKKLINSIEKLLQTFIICWIIAGSVWVYRTHPEYSKDAGPLYCNKTLYRFAFWIITLTYVCAALTLVLGCCLCSCFIFREINKDEETESETNPKRNPA